MISHACNSIIVIIHIYWCVVVFANVHPTDISGQYSMVYLREMFSYEQVIESVGECLNGLCVNMRDGCVYEWMCTSSECNNRYVWTRKHTYVQNIHNRLVLCIHSRNRAVVLADRSFLFSEFGIASVPTAVEKRSAQSRCGTRCPTARAITAG